MIREIVDKENYQIFNDKNFKCADIVLINEYSLINTSKKKYYRVDFEGVTKESKISLSEAKKLARKLVR